MWINRIWYQRLLELAAALWAYTIQQPGERGNNGNFTETREVAWTIEVSQRKEKETELEIYTLDLKSSERIKVVNGANVIFFFRFIQLPVSM